MRYPITSMNSRMYLAPWTSILDRLVSQFAILVEDASIAIEIESASLSIPSFKILQARATFLETSATIRIAAAVFKKATVSPPRAAPMATTKAPNPVPKRAALLEIPRILKAADKPRTAAVTLAVWIAPTTIPPAIPFVASTASQRAVTTSIFIFRASLSAW